MKRALVLSLICVVGLAFAGFAQTLTGSWDTEVCFDPQTNNWPGGISLTSELIVTYAIGDWAFTSTTGLDGTGWTGQEFGVTGLFGLITVDSSLVFTVPAGAFDEWVTTVGLNMAGVSFSAEFGLATVGFGTGTYLELTMAAGLGTAVEGEIVLELGDGVGCDFDFAGVTIGLDFLFCDCALIESEISFSCDGFEYVQFEASGIVIPNLPWVTLDALLYFELQTKEITLSPTFDFGAVVCFDLYFDVTDSDGATFPGAILSFTEIEVVGIGISCEIGGVSFAALSYWGELEEDDRPGALADHDDYWEVYSIDVGADACCGGLFEFGVDLFFDNDAATLFEVSLIEVDMSVNITTQFAFTLGLDVETAGGFTEFCLGFEVTW